MCQWVHGSAGAVASPDTKCNARCAESTVRGDTTKPALRCSASAWAAVLCNAHVAGRCGCLLVHGHLIAEACVMLAVGSDGGLRRLLGHPSSPAGALLLQHQFWICAACCSLLKCRTAVGEFGACRCMGLGCMALHSLPLWHGWVAMTSQTVQSAARWFVCSGIIACSCIARRPLVCLLCTLSANGIFASVAGHVDSLDVRTETV